MYDVDLDTPNNQDDLVFAPVAGLAYVHNDYRTTGFGLHINIDQGDGTYVIIAHLDQIFIDNQSEVTPGQLLGFEGTTGNSFGDHVHFGRHRGDASLDGTQGESFDGLIIDMYADDQHVQLATTDMACDLPGGQVYESALQTPLWHPSGSLIKTPDNDTIYLVDGPNLTPFGTSDAFATRNYSYADVALVSPNELNCYGLNAAISSNTEIQAMYGAFPNQAVWLLVGSRQDPERYRLLVPGDGWQAVLKSWGIQAATYDDLYQDVESGGVVPTYPYAGGANFRDGSLVSAIENSAVYVMTDGVAMPIVNWDAFLLMGWEDRTVIELAEQDLDAVVTQQGDCGSGNFCLTPEDIRSCGGAGQDYETTTETINESLAEGDDLILNWFTPDEQDVDAITLVGALTRSGQTEADWGSTFNEVQNTDHVSVTLPDLHPGDEFRFSIQYLDDWELSWSCLAPFPPGELRGSLTAEYGGAYLGYTLVGDPNPGQDGCGLKVIIE